MRNHALAATLCLSFTPIAEAEELEWDLEASLLASILDENGAADASPALFDLALGVGDEHLFDNGLAIGFRLEARVQADNDSRPAFAGDLPATDPATQRTVYRSPATGLALSDAALDDDVVAGFEYAYLYLDGGWGEASLGRDVGAASRLDARPPRLLETTGAGASRLDSTGLGFARSQNDPTGPSAKFTYLSPRWLGVRLGASFTPDVDSGGVDFDPEYDAPGVATAELENVVETGLSFSRKFGRADLRLRFGLNAVWAEAGAADNVFGDYEAYGAGAEFETGAWSGGLRYLNSNNAVSNGDYEALEASLVRELGGWRLGFEFATAEDEFLDLEGDGWAVAISRELVENVDVGFGYISNTLDDGVAGSGELGAANGFVIELTVRNK